MVINNLNQASRNYEKDKTLKSIDFIKNELNNASLSEMKLLLTSVMEDQMKNLILAEATEDFVFRAIDSPIIPEEKFGPARAIICILSTVFGFILSIVLSIYTHYYSRSNP